MALFSKQTLTVTNKDILNLINKRRRQILIHSYLYYKQDTNLINDFTFDKWCKELVTLHKQHPNESKQAVFPDAFKNWEGFSGFDLFTNDNLAEMWARNKAFQLQNYVNSL